MTIPFELVAQTQELQLQDQVDLFEITFVSGGRAYIKNGVEVTWQGNPYESMHCQLSGFSKSAGEEISRPKFQFVQLDGVFSPLVHAGELDGATLVRKRVLKEHLEADINIKQENKWIISRVATLLDEGISVELRSFADGPNATIPARSFTPPDFPIMSL